MLKSAKTLTVPSGILSDMGKSCLWIRTASGPQIGFGHLKRMMTLARLLNDCALPLFLLDPQDRWSREQLADQGMAFIHEPMNSVWSLMPDPKAILIDTRQMDGLDHLIKEAQKRERPVISIHDLGLDPLPSDIIVDGSIAPDFSNFPNPKSVFYSGTSFMILDPVYHLLHQQDKFIGDSIHTVFVNLGGGNSGRFFEKILEGLKLWDRELEVIGVHGFSSWGQESLSRKNWQPLHFRWSSEQVEPFCFQADLAITAGGLSTYEALCTGTPLMSLSYDPYQQTTIQMLAKEGVCTDLGAGEDLDAAILPDILSAMESDREKRRLYSLRGRNLVDGRGVERVAHIIREAIGAPSIVSLLERVG
jgi:UDP-2,4-diacetamido-2,4,6-trideoxy-beta-L-altropyranose hydrolase